MFDEPGQNQESPKNLPVEPADMFAGVEKNDNFSPSISTPDALSVGLLKKKDETSPLGNSQMDSGPQNFKMSAPILGKVLLSLVVVIFLGGLAYGGWRLFYQNKNKTTDLSAQPAPVNAIDQFQALQNSSSANAVAAPTTTPAKVNNDQILFGQAIDSDKDGLDDVREKEMGADMYSPDTDNDGLSDGDEVVVYKTNPVKADTDDDGLNDGDEVLIWRTNPINSDTDGDTYPDGTEVKNGYSPVGPGKLFSQTSSSTTAPTTSSPAVTTTSPATSTGAGS